MDKDRGRKGRRRREGPRSPGSALLLAEEARSLDRRGFVVLRGIADAARLAVLRAAFERVLARQLPELEGSGGVRHAERLAEKDPAFGRVVAHPKVLAAVRHVLRRPFQVLQFTARDPLPGRGLEGLHKDWRPRAPGEPYAAATALWLLDDFTAENGATRIAPGSHLMLRPLPARMTAPQSGPAGQEIILAPAGSVLVINSHLWHGPRRNATQSPRRILQCQYVDRELMSPGSVPSEMPTGLSLEARRLLYGGIPDADESAVEGGS